jgi:hypothetical protein
LKYTYTLRGQDEHVRRQLAKDLASENGATSIKCAWPLTITPKTYNCALPDMRAVYQVLGPGPCGLQTSPSHPTLLSQAMILDGLSTSTVIRITGTFPRVRYFSYQVRQPGKGTGSQGCLLHVPAQRLETPTLRVPCQPTTYS